jgi:hypothetical protein
MAFKLPDLPYEKNALEPYLSAETLEYHHDKHHNAYVTNLNGLLQDAAADNESQEDLEKLIVAAEGPLFNNAAQVWNHSFYWKCMKKGGGGEPGAELKAAIESAFGSFEDFKKELGLAGDGQRAVEGREDGERRPAPKAWPDGAVDSRCVGARLLHRLPQPAAQIRGDLSDQSGRLGLRGFELRSGEALTEEQPVCANSGGGGGGGGRGRPPPPATRPHTPLQSLRFRTGGCLGRILPGPVTWLKTTRRRGHSGMASGG